MKNFYKILLPFLFLFTLSIGVYAQNVQVAGAITGNGIYPDLGSAFVAINGGVQTGATIVVTVLGNTTELASATLNANTWSTLSLSPSGGSARTITGNIAGPLIDLSGCTNVTIDGLNTGGNSLTISNTATGSASTIRFINDASNNVITKCTIQGSASTLQFGTLLFSTGLVSGNDNNNINNCIINQAGANYPINAVFSLGSSSVIDNSGNTLNANEISNFFNAVSTSMGIHLNATNSGNSGWTITNNKFFQSVTQTYTTANTHQVIFVGSGGGYQITGNTIGFASSAGTGTYTMISTVATRLIGIGLGMTAGAANSTINNNIVSGISLTTSSGAATTNGVICGINITAGNATINGNTIGATTGVNSIVAIPTTTQGAVVGINSSSTGTVSITNNNIGALSSSGSTAAVAGAIMGINVSGVAASMTITGNTIGNTTADNMRGGTLGLTTGNSIVSGINLPSTPSGTINVSNNTIRNLSSYGTGTTGYVRGLWTAATTGSLSVYSILNNTISNLTTNSALTTITSGQIGALGICLGVGNNSFVSQNTITGISNINTGTNGSYVAGITCANATNSTIFGNRIFNITNAGTSTTTTAPSVAAGIIVRSGTTAIHVNNNMISLGNGQTTNTLFIGIQCNHGSTPDPVNNIYFNSINIEGTVAAGAQPSFGIARTDFTATARTPVMNVQNNIVTNSRSGGTGKHYAIANNYGAAAATTTGWGANFSNYNVLNANPATVGLWTTDQNFASWQTASAGDVNSMSGVSIVFTNAATADLHITGFPTPIEGTGTPIAGITLDYDNQLRSNLSPVDIGADANNFFNYPVISYTPLAGTCTFGARTLTATITDVDGVPTAGIGLPQLFWRINAGPYTAVAGTSIGSNQYTFTFGAGVSVGDVVQYYIAAQDNLGNAGTAPALGASGFTINPPAAAVPPSNPSSYSINLSLSGTYTVGVGGNFTTLTSAVNAYNVACLTGPVVFSLIDATYPSETFPITIQANASVSNVNTLTIKPTLAGTVLSGSSATGMLMMNGADYVTIDGSISNVSNAVCPSASASRDLSIINTNAVTTAAVVWLGTSSLGDSVTNCQVKNCILSGASSTTTIVGLGAGGTTIGTGGTSNNNLVFENNDIRACQFGIYSAGISALNKNQTISITKNVMNSLSPNSIGQSGIYVAFTNNVLVSGNTVGNIINATSAQDPVAINLGFGAVNGFAIGTTGIADGVSNVTVTNNVIGTIQQSVTYAAIGIGIGNTISGTSLIANNMISGVAANGTASDFAGGIVLGGGTAPVNVWHNTVLMQGVIPGATAASVASVCFGTTTATPFPLTLKNNIFVNTQIGNAGATLRFAAIGLGHAAPYTGLISNNNDIFSAGAGPGTYTTGVTGGLTGTNRITLTDWQMETSQDALSLNVSPTFVSPTDLHLVPASSAVFDNAGAAVALVTNDIDCQGRNTATPVIGADEFCSLTAVVITSVSDVTCFGSSDGSATATPNGNDAPFAYSWTPSGGTLATASYISANTYTVTVSDAMGCTATTTTIISQPTQLVTTASAGSIACNGGTTTLTATASGGTAGYSYAWLDGTTVTNTITLNPLKDNTMYEISGNSNGIGEHIIAGNSGSGEKHRALLTFDLASVIPVGSTINSASLSMFCTATSGAAGSQNQSLHKLLQNWGEGTSNALSVGVGAPATIGDATWLMRFHPSTAWSTAGGTFVPVASATTTIGSASSSYSWSAASLLSDVQGWVNTPSTNFGWILKGNESGAYQAKRFASRENSIAANRPALTINYTGPNVIGTSSTLAGVAAGTYTLVVTDANGCTSSSVLTVSQPAPIVVGASASPSNLCLGSSSTLTGSGASTYLWNPGSLTGSPSVTPAATTIYTVTGTDGNGCTATSSVTVTVNSTPVVTANAVPAIICSGQSSQLSTTPAYSTNYLVSSIPFAPLTPTGVPTVLQNGGVVAQALSSGSLDDGIWTVALPAGFDFSFYNVPQTTIDISTNGFLGFGSLSAANGCCSGQVLPDVGTPNNVVAMAWEDWNHTAGTMDVFTEGTAPNRKFVVRAQGIPRFGGTGAPTTAMIILNETVNTIEMHLTSVTSGASDLTTQGIENAGGTLATVVTGRNSTAWSASNEGWLFAPPVTVGTTSWLPLSGLSDPNIPNPVATPLATTTYTVTVSNASGCTATATQTVSINPAPSINASASPASVCLGSSVTLTGSGGISGSYVWTGGVSNGIAFNPAATATYTVTGADALGCTGTSSITVQVNQFSNGVANPELLYYKFDGAGTSVPNQAITPPAGTATATIMGAITQGGTGLTGGALIGSGIAASTDYLNTGWTTNLTGTSWTISFWSSNITPSATLFYIFGDNTAGSFRCFTNGVAGANNWILRGPIADISIPGGATVAPHLNTFVYDAVAGQTRSYRDGVLMSTVTQAAPTISGTGPFKVMGYGTNVGAPSGGLLDEFRLYNRALTQPEILQLLAPGPVFAATASPTTVCAGANVTLSGTGVNSYLWNPGAVSGTPITVNPVASTIYTLTGTDANGCTGTTSVSVTVNPLPPVTASSTPTPATVCAGANVTLSGGGASSYTWTDGSNTPADNVAFAPVASSTYTVTGTDGNGCSNTSTLAVTVNALPTVTASITPATTCISSIAIPNSGGTATSYSWSGGLTDGQPFLVPLGANTYTVTGTDGNGCTASSTAALNGTAASGGLAPATTSSSQNHGDDLNASYYDASCNLIASVDDGSGGNILGLTTATVNVQGTAGFHNGQPFVRRWYQITPTSNGGADVQLYITQADFDDYNAVVTAPYLPLPTGPADVTGIANVRITKNADAGLGNSPVEITPTVSWNGNYWVLSFSTPSFSQFRVHSANPGGTPLPVTLTNFDGRKLNSSNLLEWSTSAELNNAYFNLQYSTNGTDFTTIAKVDSKAPNGMSATKLNYSYEHNTPALGHNYYRLQQVDLDGNSTQHAKVVDLIWGANGSTVSLYPNPTKDVLNIDLYTTRVQNTTVKVLDMSGRIVKQIQARSEAGMNKLSISLGEVAGGIYTVQVFENDQLTHVDRVNKK